MINFVIDKDSAGARIDKLLMSRYDAGFGVVQKLLRSKNVKINGKSISKPIKIEEGDEVQVYADLKPRKIDEKPRARVSDSAIEEFLSLMIYEDEHIFAIDKPSGLAVQGRSLARPSIDDILHNLKKKGYKLHLVHRIDRDTSGVLILAKTKDSAAILTEHFKNKTIKKTYVALLYGNLQKKEGVIDIPLKKKRVDGIEKVYPDFEGGDKAISQFKLIENYQKHCLVELMPITGRTHQLRVHVKEIGHPIIGDFKYGGKKVIIKDLCDRLALHAQKIEIDDYFGKPLIIKAKLPYFI